MKYKFYLVISIMLLSASLSACKFNLGGNTTSDSGSSNAANRSTAKSDNPDKTKTKAKPNAEESDSRKTDDDSAAIEETSDEESSDSGEYDLVIRRTFQIGEKHDGNYQHGDYTIIRELENGGTLGSLHLFKPQEAVFILWDGEVYAGPLTTVEQLEEAYARLSKESAAGHETRMNIMKNYPTGGKKRVRVYDSKGNYIREEYEP
ncbi:MAG: hypothetical protein M3367_19335 [Acidobacteriota bacterium]|nr:hypothetical protein [Acidobacteriota bacterium]